MGVCEGHVVRGTVNHFRHAGLLGRLAMCKACQRNLVKTFPFIRLRSHYAVLGLSPKATKAEIKKAYIRLSKQEHPDTKKSGRGSHDAFVKINEAYNVLANEKTRIEYDAQLNVSKTRPGNPQARYHNSPYSSPYGHEPYGQSYQEAYREASQRGYGGSHYRSRAGSTRGRGFTRDEWNQWTQDERSHDGFSQNPFESGYEKRGLRKLQWFILISLFWMFTLLCFMWPLIWLLYIRERPPRREKSSSKKSKRTGKAEDDMQHVNRFDMIFNVLMGFVVLVAAYECLHLLFSYVYYKKSEEEFEIDEKEVMKYDIQVTSLFLASMLLLNWRWFAEELSEIRAKLSNSAQPDQQQKTNPNKQNYSVSKPVKDSGDELSTLKQMVEDAPVRKTRARASTVRESSPVSTTRVEKSPVKTIQLEEPPVVAVKDSDRPMKTVSIKDSPLSTSSRQLDVKPVQSSRATSQLDMKPVQSSRAESFTSQSS